jgi:hypothetical protein
MVFLSVARPSRAKAQSVADEAQKWVHCTPCAEPGAWLLPAARTQNNAPMPASRRLRRAGFNYVNIGGTSSSPELPQAVTKGGWAIDHARVKVQCRKQRAPAPPALPSSTCTRPATTAPHPQVGRGKHTFENAKRLVGSWGHFQLGWADVDPATPVRRGAPVCVRASTLGVWTLNPLQIV